MKAGSWEFSAFQMTKHVDAWIKWAWDKSKAFQFFTQRLKQQRTVHQWCHMVIFGAYILHLIVIAGHLQVLELVQDPSLCCPVAYLVGRQLSCRKIPGSIHVRPWTAVTAFLIDDWTSDCLWALRSNLDPNTPEPQAQLFWLMGLQLKCWFFCRWIFGVFSTILPYQQPSTSKNLFGGKLRPQYLWHGAGS